jgi:hypothetical protein
VGKKKSKWRLWLARSRPRCASTGVDEQRPRWVLRKEEPETIRIGDVIPLLEERDNFFAAAAGDVKTNIKISSARVSFISRVI